VGRRSHHDVKAFCTLCAPYIREASPNTDFEMLTAMFLLTLAVRRDAGPGLGSARAHERATGPDVLHHLQTSYKCQIEKNGTVARIALVVSRAGAMPYPSPESQGDNVESTAHVRKPRGDGALVLNTCWQIRRAAPCAVGCCRLAPCELPACKRLQALGRAVASGACPVHSRAPGGDAGARANGGAATGLAAAGALCLHAHATHP
jgi:hypothetical protein